MQLHQAIPLREALAGTAKTDMELAGEIGVNVTTIWRWRTGKSIPASQAMRDRAAHVLGRKLTFGASSETKAAA
jgi:transcriptional regulator with XRE-family HTH domain